MRGVLKRFSIAMIIFSCVVVQSAAQISISGTLIDKDDRTPLAFANVGLLKSSDSSFVKGTTTDEKGFYRLAAPDSGNYFIRVSYVGYGTQFIPVLVNPDAKKIEELVLEISKSSQTLGEVEITAKKPMYAYEGEKKVYNVSEDPSVQSGVANDALQNAPGVYVDMEGNITLRGVSGVEIWLNDKPSKIKAEGLKSFLQQLPANAIERIEVITNPSARYGASGTGGIINIITKEKIKKNLLFSFGLNGSTQTSYSPWVSFVASNDKISFNTYISHSRFEGKYNSNSASTLFNNGDTVYSVNNKSWSEYGYQWTYAHVNFTWQIDKKTSFDTWLGGSFSSNDNESGSESVRTMNGGETYNIKQTNNGEGDGSNMYGGLSFMRQFKKEGHQLSLDSYFGNYSNDGSSFSEKLYDIQTGMNRRYITDNSYNGTWVSAELNYENPLGKNRKLEAGGEISGNLTKQHAPIDTFNFGTGVYQYVPLFSNFLDQDVMSSALYTTYSDTLWFLSYKVGLRYEYAQMLMKSVVLEDNLRRHYGTIFPTLHLAYKSKKGANFTASYSRRVQYPEYELDPFVNRIGEEYISSGNPYLDPAYTDAYEFGYGHFFKSGNSLSATLYYRRTMRDITSKTEGIYDPFLSRYTVYDTYINAGKSIFTGADATYTFKIKKSSRLMLNFNLYDQDFSADLGTYTVDKHSLTYNGKMIYMWNYKFLRLNVTGIYRAAAASIQGNEEPTYFINATVSADLFDKKMSVRLGMQDIFNWLENTSSMNTPTIVSTSTSKSNSQYFTFGITFRFGKVELEQQQMQPNNQMTR